MGPRVFFPSPSWVEKRTGKRAEYLMPRFLNRAMISNGIPDGVKGCIEDAMCRLVGDLEEPGPRGRDWEGVRLVIRAPCELRRVSGDSAEEVDSLEVADKVRSDDLIIRLHHADVREERVGVAHGRGRTARLMVIGYLFARGKLGFGQLRSTAGNQLVPS